MINSGDNNWEKRFFVKLNMSLGIGYLHWEKAGFNPYSMIDQNIDEYLIYSLFNIIDQDNKYLIINSLTPINEMNFKLDDLKSRTKNCLVAKIDKPDDELMFALILKNFSDRQIVIDKKLINFIIKRVDRSYDKIFEFIYKIDEISLKKKKSIDFKIIKEVLKV